jgi:hypothetical protein
VTRFRLAAVIAACAAALALPACGSDDEQPAGDAAAPQATETPTPDGRGYGY